MVQTEKWKGGVIWMLGVTLIVFSSVALHEGIHVVQHGKIDVLENTEVSWYFVGHGENWEEEYNRGTLAGVVSDYKQGTADGVIEKTSFLNPTREYQAYTIQFMYIIFALSFLWFYIKRYNKVSGARYE